ncbi:MAG TPA: MarR family transcriptional regulator [Gaiellaceae bacterium]|nr:MarR family transcriptional regulator [Gaiellaceae bacterium]
MMRTRTTVEQQPGLFLQPLVLDQLLAELMLRVVGPSAVSGKEFAVTGWLESSGPLTPTALARVLGMSPTTLSAMIGRLVRKGQVRRAPNPDDGRSYLIELTDAGHATNRDCLARFRVELDAVRGHLDGNAEEILAGMRVLETALRRRLDELSAG